MGRLDEQISAQFARWEQRGRGWQVWPAPVLPEPPFQEFTGYQLPATAPVDDGRRPGFLASLFDSLHQKLNPPLPVREAELTEPEPEPSEHLLTTEFTATLPASLKMRDEAMRAFVESLAGCVSPTAFELFGKENHVAVQFAASQPDAPVLQRQLTAFFPELTFVPAEGAVADTWNETGGVGFIVDFGLSEKFMLPLQTEHHVDPFVGLVSALSELRHDETALLQVLFQPVTNPWAASVWRSVTDADGKMIFGSRPDGFRTIAFDRLR